MTGERAADLSLADVMADFEPSDRCRQEYEALTRERDEARGQLATLAAGTESALKQELAAAWAERDALQGALEQVEWRLFSGDGDPICPWCEAGEWEGHKPDCPRQVALSRAGEGRTERV